MKSNIVRLKTNQVYFPSQRIQNANWSYSTRRVPADSGDYGLSESVTPRAGDVVLATVVRLGQHRRIELVSGRRARMFVNDDIVVVYGNRYAPDQFEAIVPDNLGPCQLVAAGGIAAQMIHKHGAMKNPTKIKPLGVLTHADGSVVNLKQYAIDPHLFSKPLPPVIAVVGGSMNTGKTTTVASLVRGLTQAGFNVSAGKVTGTGSGCDGWHVLDAGAQKVMDFLDAGHSSTYLLAPAQVERIFETLLSHLNQEGTDFIILEVADGLLQSETRQLINSKLFHSVVSGVMFTAVDALGAVQGVDMLQQWGVPVFAVSGVITRSPLGVREALDVFDIPVLNRNALTNPAIESHVSAWLGSQHPAARAGGYS